MADPYTSEWWLERLCKELDGRAFYMRRLQDYYDGRQPLSMASAKFQEAFGKLFRSWSDNFCSLVVRATEERLSVEGFRFGSKARDTRAWRFWQTNQMDAWSQRAHREALIKGDCPVIVAPNGSSPLIRVQKPEEVVVAYDDDPLVRAVALKRWEGLDKRKYATLYYPDRIEKYVWLDTARDAAGRFSGGFAGWAPREVDGELWPLRHDLGVVPVVPLINDPDLDNRGNSEIAGVLPLQDALNKLYVDLLIASEFGAFRQRWATGLEIPNNPDTGKPMEPYKAGVDRIWSTPATDAKFGDFEQTRLDGIISAIETTIQHFASKTSTPAHYLLGQSGTFPSGESLKATETGLVSKAKRRARDFGEGHEEIERLCFRAVGDSIGAEFVNAETIWADPETRTESEHVDALTKLRAALRIPLRQLWEDAGYTPTQITRFDKWLRDEAAAGPGTVPGYPEPSTTEAEAEAAATVEEAA